MYKCKIFKTRVNLNLGKYQITLCGEAFLSAYGCYLLGLIVYYYEFEIEIEQNIYSNTLNGRTDTSIMP